MAYRFKESGHSPVPALPSRYDTSSENLRVKYKNDLSYRGPETEISTL